LLARNEGIDKMLPKYLRVALSVITGILEENIGSLHRSGSSVKYSIYFWLINGGDFQLLPWDLRDPVRFATKGGINHVIDPTIWKVVIAEVMAASSIAWRNPPRREPGSRAISARQAALAGDGFDSEGADE
jgi:hypothetical protein